MRGDQGLFGEMDVSLLSCPAVLSSPVAFFPSIMTVSILRARTGSHSLLYPTQRLLINKALSKDWIFFFFWPLCVASGILVLQAELQPGSPALQRAFLTAGLPGKSPGLNHFTQGKETSRPTQDYFLSIIQYIFKE